MKNKFIIYILLFIITATNSSCLVKNLGQPSESDVEPTKGYGTLGNFPFHEAWYGIYFQEDKIGYSHFKITPDGNDFLIKSDSMMRLTAMRKTNEVKMKENIKVAPDLSLISFESTVDMNQKELKVEGKVENSKLHLKMNVSDEKVERDFPLDGKIYHTSAISLMPALKGLKEGSKYSFNVFNVERQSIESIEQEISRVQGSPGPSGAVWRVTNNYGQSKVTSWLNRKGLVTLEKGLDGSLITILEDEGSAQKFLQAKVPQKDLILDFSLVKSPVRIANPGSVKMLKVCFQGVNSGLFAQDQRQKVSDSRDGVNIEVDVENLQQFQADQKGAIARQDEFQSKNSLSKYLDSTTSIQSDNKEIGDQARKIISSKLSTVDNVVKLVNWTADNIKGNMKESFCSLDVFRSREGECKSHTRLYAAMARAVGIPTRVVTGLVYADNLGFSYHAWAESYVKGWLSVDPTLKQVPSDATHIKLASSEDDDPSAVLKVMGKIKIKSLEYQ
ncbi:MAG: transglutaminase-like domain-containing protein [Desulfomonilaceae bacterium]